jgi:hypothetical protein
MQRSANRTSTTSTRASGHRATQRRRLCTDGDDKALVTDELGHSTLKFYPHDLLLIHSFRVRWSVSTAF